MSSVPAAPQQPKLLDRLRAACRVRHYSLRTEEAYAAWVVRFIRFHGLRHPLEMGTAQINAFLTHLAVEGHVSASTQNQAFSAILFLYQKVLEVDPGQITGVIRAQRPVRLPVVLTRDEAARVLAELDGTYRLIGQLLYGAGLRLIECLRLRVKDVDWGLGQLLVRHGKAGKDRRTILPGAVRAVLQAHLERVQAAPARSGAGLRPGGVAGRPGPQAAVGHDGLALAVGLPVRDVFERPALGRAAAAPRARGIGNAGHHAGGAALGDCQAGDEPLVPPQLCNAPARGWL
jgi:integrase